MRLRIGSLDGQAGDVLLAAASAADPTVELLAQVVGTTTEHAVELLDEAERKSIVVIEGDRVRFSHPLLAHSVYADASPARRRAMHRALSDVVTLPELKARHMALAAARGRRDLQGARHCGRCGACTGRPGRRGRVDRAGNLTRR